MHQHGMESKCFQRRVRACGSARTKKDPFESIPESQQQYRHGVGVGTTAGVVDVGGLDKVGERGRRGRGWLRG